MNQETTNIFTDLLDKSGKSNWITFSIISIWHGSEYASSSENTSITQGSVENSSPYMFDMFEYPLGSQSARAWIYKGHEYAKVTHGST